jgi:urease alpha subunit
VARSVAALHSHFLIAAQAASLLRQGLSALVFAAQSPYSGRQALEIAAQRFQYSRMLGEIDLKRLNAKT